MSDKDRDVQFMIEAINLARRAVGRTSPNPLVGAIVVCEGQAVGRGFHPQAGAPHAEVFALREAGPLAQGATLYVTLEPCSHWGRTGPCTQAIMEAGIARVVAAMEDPDGKVHGAGFAALRKAGLEVTVGVLRETAESLNEAYLKHRRSGLPFVTLKWAMSLDGKIAARRGGVTWLTGEAAQRYTHELRNTHDAILVGINTVLADDPQLTCRIPGGRDPVRIILDSRVRVPLEAKVLNSAARTLIVTTTQASQAKIQAVREKGTDVLIYDGQRPPLPWLLRDLADQGVLSVLVEGGGTVHAAVLEEGLADKIVAFVSPSILGGLEAPTPVAGKGLVSVSGVTIRLDRFTVRQVGDDVILEGYVHYPSANSSAQGAEHVSAESRT